MELKNAMNGIGLTYLILKSSNSLSNTTYEH